MLGANPSSWDSLKTKSIQNPFLSSRATCSSLLLSPLQGSFFFFKENRKKDKKKERKKNNQHRAYARRLTAKTKKNKLEKTPKKRPGTFISHCNAPRVQRQKRKAIVTQGKKRNRKRGISTRAASLHLSSFRNFEMPRPLPSTTFPRWHFQNPNPTPLSSSHHRHQKDHLFDQKLVMGSSPAVSSSSVGCCDMSLKCWCRWRWHHCFLSSAFIFFLASFLILGSVASIFAWLTFSPYERPPSLSSLGCSEDNEGSWSVGIFYGDSPFSLKPIESVSLSSVFISRFLDFLISVLEFSIFCGFWIGWMQRNVWRDESAAWPVANPVVTCASVSDAGFPSNFVADPFLFVQVGEDPCVVWIAVSWSCFFFSLILNQNWFFFFKIWSGWYLCVFLLKWCHIYALCLGRYLVV